REPKSAWSDEARRKLRADEMTRSETEEWQRASARLTSLAVTALARVTQRFPQQARQTAEGALIAEWASAVSAGDEQSATRYIVAAQVIGEAIRCRSGDSLLGESVAAIQRADDFGRRRLAQAQLIYRAGRLALRATKTAEAIRTLDAAADSFGKNGSPMA